MRRLLPIGALLAVLAWAAPAHALELAVQDDPVLHDRSYSDASLALERAADLGAERIRVNLRWFDQMPLAQARAKRAPDVVEWDFTRLRRLLDDAEARGLRLQVTLTGPAPAWATGDKRVGYTRPNPARFGEFAAAAVGAMEGRVDRWSIWNEPNWHRLLAPARRAPSLYRALYRSGYRAITWLDPSAKILIGEMMPGANRTKSTPALRFLRRLLCSGCSPLYADGFALHPYNFARRPSLARSSNPDVVEMGSLSRLTRFLDSRRYKLRPRKGGRMPVYLTEFGYFTSGPLRQSPRTHARWLAEAWKIAARNRRVRQLLQYQLIDPWPKSITWRSAVMSRDGTPRPAFDALRALASNR